MHHPVVYDNIHDERENISSVFSVVIRNLIIHPGKWGETTWLGWASCSNNRLRAILFCLIKNIISRPREIIDFLLILWKKLSSSSALVGRVTSLSALPLWCAEQSFLLLPAGSLGLLQILRDSFGCKHLFGVQIHSSDCHGGHPKPLETLKCEFQPEKLRKTPSCRAYISGCQDGASDQNPLKESKYH